MRRNRGFTLIEVIVVAAIIAILAGILVPMIFNQIDETKKTRALADCKSISTAITMFRKDTTKWPYFDSEDCTFTYLTLQTGTGSDPVDAPAPGDWKINFNAVALGFVLNLPGVNPAVAQACYGGKAAAYMTEDRVDPWGNKYIVNAASFGTAGPVWVISAGPNGALDTNSTSQTLNDIGTNGDDIGVRIK
jgi:general secretion pathway protein G